MISYNFYYGNTGTTLWVNTNCTYDTCTIIVIGENAINYKIC